MAKTDLKKLLGVLYRPAPKGPSLVDVPKAKFLAIDGIGDPNTAKSFADAVGALDTGTDAYLDAMTVPGRTRLLLIDGPAALGRKAMDEIDRETSGGTIVVGLSGATGRPPDARMEVQGRLLSAAFERAALDIADGADPVTYRTELKRMLAETCGRA